MDHNTDWNQQSLKVEEVENVAKASANDMKLIPTLILPVMAWLFLPEMITRYIIFVYISNSNHNNSVYTIYMNISEHFGFLQQILT